MSCSSVKYWMELSLECVSEEIHGARKSRGSACKNLADYFVAVPSRQKALYIEFDRAGHCHATSRHAKSGDRVATTTERRQGSEGY